MKIIGKILLLFLILIITFPLLILADFGFIPGLSSLMGSNKPRDLGIKYTQEDLISAHSKSKIEYVALPANTPVEMSLQRTGSRPITAQFSSAEITASMNNQKWKYWPYKNVQVKFNADGSGEISGILIKDRVPSYATAIGIPKEAVNFAMKFLPSNPVFYVKGRAALTENKVSLFEPEAFEIGRIPMPVEVFLSFSPLPKPALAQDTNNMSDQLAKVKNKKALIIDYINSRISSIQGFYAKNAKFTENQLIFDGNLSEKIATVQ